MLHGSLLYSSQSLVKKGSNKSPGCQQTAPAIHLETLDASAVMLHFLQYHVVLKGPKMNYKSQKLLPIAQ